MGFYNDETNNFMRIGICGLELELEVIDGNHTYIYICIYIYYDIMGYNGFVFVLVYLLNHIYIYIL